MYPTFCRKPDVRQNSRLGSRDTQSGQSRLFLPFFFGFSNIPAELFILEENFCPLKFRSYQDASFRLIGRSLKYFLTELLRNKTSKIVKFAKIHQTLRNTHFHLTWPKRSRFKLVFLPNLLMQKNVCLIPCEPEHPSMKIVFLFKSFSPELTLTSRISTWQKPDYWLFIDS